MDGETTSRGGLSRFVPRMWGEWARFVARPRIPDAREPFGRRALGEVGQLLALIVAIDLVLIIGLSWLATRLGVKTPEFEELRQYGPAVMLAIGALGVPVLEEMVFRGPLDGRRRTLVAVAVVLAAVAMMVAVRVLLGPGQWQALALILTGALTTGAILVWRAEDGVPDWFARSFPVIFWVSTLAFGLAHMSNYDLDRPLLLLPFVMPQLLAGTIFAFARVRFGMWSNIALHAMSNALFLGLALSGL